MNAIAAISLAFLKGDVLTIKTAFRDYGISNLPRECGRSIERKFGVKLAKVKREGKSRYGIPCYWYEYRLPKVPYNVPGIQKMVDYCKSQSPATFQAKTDKQLKELRQIELFINQ